jgi:hypothetical protein
MPPNGASPSAFDILAREPPALGRIRGEWRPHRRSDSTSAPPTSPVEDVVGEDLTSRRPSSGGYDGYGHIEAARLGPWTLGVADCVLEPERAHPLSGREGHEHAREPHGV